MRIQGFAPLRVSRMRKIIDGCDPARDHVLIIADIEGSSGCWSYRASSFLTPEWYRACLEMSRDIGTVTEALFQSGVKSVTIKDFHRTGYNLMRDCIDPRAKILHGYRKGPVPGIGAPGSCGLAMFIGMHAASGSCGFLSHTLTSRIARLEVNGEIMPEVFLFSASLAPAGFRPVFFSGCPVACRQAEYAIPHIESFPIMKTPGDEGTYDREGWRKLLAQATVHSLDNRSTIVPAPAGPFHVAVTLRDGEKAAMRIARRWKLSYSADTIIFDAWSFDEMYYTLIRICYLTRFTELVIGPALAMYNIVGKAGLARARRACRADESCRHVAPHGRPSIYRSG